LKVTQVCRKLRNIYSAFLELLDQNHPIHHRIKEIKNLFKESKGASMASDIIEQIIRPGVDA
jgi:hypothetical protein